MTGGSGNRGRGIRPAVLAVAWLVAGCTPAPDLPWLGSLAEDRKRDSIESITAVASVVASDGVTYRATTHFEERDRAVFRVEYPDRTVTHGVEGGRVWTGDGEEGSAFLGEIVRGHQFHAQLLFYDRLHGDTRMEAAVFDGRACTMLAGLGENDLRIFFVEGGLPLGMEQPREGMPLITFRLDDWRATGGVRLPHRIHVDDGERTFDYSFTDIRFNEGGMADYR